MNILVTGGASGVGEAITRTLAQDDKNTVYFTYSKSVANAEKITAAFKNSTAISCDFEEEQAVIELTDKISTLDLDVLIHNAYGGAFLKTHFHKIETTDFLTDFKTNIMPVVAITQVAIANFRKKKSGKIITVLTAALHELPPIGSAVYSANKAYLQKLTQVWANENEKYNISSNSVSPTFMETKMTNSIDERIKEQIKENSPLNRLLTTEEVAQAVLFLTYDATNINGKDFVITAGSLLR